MHNEEFLTVDELCSRVKFGHADDLPSLSSDDDFETITVKPAHVDQMAQFVDDIYAAENCRLHYVFRKLQAGA